MHMHPQGEGWPQAQEGTTLPVPPWTSTGPVSAMLDPSGGLPEVDTFRVVVAMGWRDVVPLRTTLTAYGTMIPVGALTSFVVRVPHDVGPVDAETLRVLLDDLNKRGHSPASVSLESFQETVRRPALVALVPGGDVHVLISEVGDFIVGLHILADLVRNPRALAASRPPTCWDQARTRRSPPPLRRSFRVSKGDHWNRMRTLAGGTRRADAASAFVVQEPSAVSCASNAGQMPLLARSRRNGSITSGARARARGSSNNARSTS